jgi:hypothetical protein
MTDLFFGLKQNSLAVQTFQDGVLVDQQMASQNGIAPDAGSFKIFAVDSADTGRNAGFVDRTWVDQGEGIGIADGGDGTTNARIDGDEALGISFGNYKTKTANILLDRMTSTDGAQVRVRAFKDGVEVDSQVIAISGDGRQPLNFSSLFSFDEIQISAADDDTKFTFRSVNLKDASLEVLSLRQQGNSTTLQALQDGVVIGQATASQNGPLPAVGPFTISATNSPDAGSNPFVDRTWFDQGEGTGIIDGDDRGNTVTRKRIEGDEILGISFVSYLAKDALINVDRIDSFDGAAIRVEAFKAGVSVDSEIFTLGSGSLVGDRTFTFGSDSLFDTVKLSAADSDTRFTFRGLDLPGAFAV